MKKVIIIIPVYKKYLNLFEKISLQQVNRILGKYDISFYAPESLNFNYGDDYKNYRVERFPDKFFVGTNSYSSLMMSVELYNRFSEYEYILIYQLDAFVFSDKLQEFCDLSYDYIGAPWPACCPNYRMTRSYVGNGGFSLRKVESTIRLLKSFDWNIVTERMKLLIDDFEDLFFSYAATLPEYDYKMPNRDVAIKFSIEHNVRHVLDNLNINNLPFGCHAWYKLNGYMWKPYVESYGYKYELENLNGWENSTHDFRIFMLGEYILERLSREHKYETWMDLNEYIGKNVIIWGAGADFKRIYPIFCALGIKIDYIFDKNAKIKNIFDIPLIYPSKENIISAEQIIIIMTSKFENEIYKKLIEFGKKEYDEFLRISYIKKQILYQYIRNVFIK